MASLLDWIKKRAEGAYAQVNPFDNGATYNTVVNNQPPPQARPPVNLNQQARQQFNSPATLLARGLAFNPLTLPSVLLSRLNPTSAEQSVQQTGNFLANAPILKQVRQGINAMPIDLYGHKGSDVVKLANESIVQPTLKQGARFQDVITGRREYDPGVKGLAQYGSDVATLGSLAYTGGKALQLGKAPTLAAAAKLAPNVAARQFASGAGQNVLYQAAEGKKLNEINPLEAALSGGAYAALGTGIPLATKALKRPATNAAQALAGQVSGQLKKVTPVAKAVGSEINDRVMKVKPDKTALPAGLLPGENLTKVGNVIDHPELFKKYPGLKNTDINIDINPKYRASGVTIPNGDGTFTIGLQVPNKAAIKKVFTHEAQHYVDAANGKPYAGVSLADAQAFLKQSQKNLSKRGAELANPNENSFDLYYRNVGEVRARNAAARRNMTPAERTARPFDSTVDVPQNLQLKFGEGGKAQSLDQILAHYKQMGGVDLEVVKAAYKSPASLKKIAKAQEEVRIAKIENKQLAQKEDAIYRKLTPTGTTTIKQIRAAEAELKQLRATAPYQARSAQSLPLQGKISKDLATLKQLRSQAKTPANKAYLDKFIKEAEKLKNKPAQSTTLPKGYKLTDNGDVINVKTGKPLTEGEIQRLTQPKELTQAENAVNAGKMKLSDTQAIENKLANKPGAMQSIPEPKKLSGAKKVGNSYEEVGGNYYRSKPGYKVVQTGLERGNKDYGVDLIAKSKKETVVIQAKNRRNLQSGTAQYHAEVTNQYKRTHPKENVRGEIIVTTRKPDPQNIFEARNQGLTVRFIDKRGNEFAPALAPFSKQRILSKPLEMGNTDQTRILNSIPAARKAEFLEGLKNPKSAIYHALETRKQDKWLSVATDYFKAKYPSEYYSLTSLKGISRQIAQAKSPQEVNKIVNDLNVANKEQGGSNALFEALPSRLKNKQFMSDLVNQRSEYQVRRMLDPEGNIYNPVRSNVGKLNDTLAKTSLTTGEGFQPGKAVYKQSSLPQTARVSESLTPEFRRGIQNVEYRVIPNGEALARAGKKVEDNFAGALEDATNLSLHKGPIHLGSGRLPTVDEVANAMLVVDKLSRDGNYTQANKVIENLTKQSTELGRAVQILSLYNKVSPEGIGRYAQAMIRRYNSKVRVGKQIGDLSDAQLRGFTERARNLERMAEGRDKNIETAKLVRDVEALVPATWQQKGAMYLYLAQLIFPKTAIRNIVGNSFMLVAEDISRLIGAPVDAVASMITKRPREIYAPHILRQMGDLARGFKVGAEESVQGIDLRNIAEGKYDVKPFVFKSKAGKTLEKALAIELTAFDRAFYEAARNNVIRDMTRGVSKRTGIPINKVKVTQEMLDSADAFGKYMTYQDDSALARLAVDFKHGLNRITTGSDAFGAGSAVMNFPKTPANLLLRGLDFSPAGYLRVIADIVRPLIMRGEKFNKAKFVADASRATTGSMGLVGLGALLQTVGIVTPGNKDASKDVNAFEKSIGSGNYKFNVDGFKRYVFGGFNPDQAKPQQGDQLVSYDWAQPLAIPFTAGAEIAQQSSSIKQSTKKRIASLGNVGAQIAEGAQTLTEQPLLQGVQKLFSSQNGINGALSLAQGVPSSFVPASIRGVRNLTDNVSRETYSPNWAQGAYNMAANSIPGLSKTLPARYTPLGETAENYQNGTNNLFNVAFNPAFVSKYQTNDVQSEIQRLFAKTGNASVIPNLSNTNYTINGQNYTLSGKQKSEFQKTMGTTTNTILDRLFQTDYYQGADDLTRQKMIQNVITDATAVAKTRVLGVLDDNLSSRAKVVLAGGIPDYSGRKVSKTTKATTKKASSGKVSSGGGRRGGSSISFAKATKVSAPKGIKVRSVAYKKTGTKKLSVASLPKLSKGRKLA